MFYENMSGYLRGFGISLTPAPHHHDLCLRHPLHIGCSACSRTSITFANIVMVYPHQPGYHGVLYGRGGTTLPPGTHLSRHPNQSDSPLNTTLNATPVIN